MDEQDASAVLVTAELRNEACPAKVLGDRPRITVRLGVDQDPVDLADPAARAWLEAFIWPEHAAALGGRLAGRNSEYLIGTSLRDPDGGQEDSLLALADPYLR